VNELVILQTMAEDLLRRLQVDGLVKVKKDSEYLVVDITTPEAARMIGNKGEVLDALQHLIRSLASRHLENRFSITVDIEGYRQRRNEYLIGLAKNVAKRVKQTGKHEALSPMSAGERRIVHMTVKEMEGVVSESIGEGIERRIVVKPIMKAIW
jgi:spoIIIJ-associated protein